MGLDFELIPGQTPLDEEEKDGLLISTITTRQELDEFEQLNIESAIKWTLSKKFKKEEILTEHFVKQVHKKMHGDVWVWAGEFRRTNKNIGVDWRSIAMELRQLTDNCKHWIDQSIHRMKLLYGSNIALFKFIAFEMATEGIRGSWVILLLRRSLINLFLPGAAGPTW